MVLDSLLQMALLEQRDWTRWFPESPAHHKISVILQFSLLFEAKIHPGLVPPVQQWRGNCRITLDTKGKWMS